MIQVALFDIDGVLNSGAYTSYEPLGIDREAMQGFWAEFVRTSIVGSKDTKDLIQMYTKQWGYTGTEEDFFTILARKRALRVPRDRRRYLTIKATWCTCLYSYKSRPLST